MTQLGRFRFHARRRSRAADRSERARTKVLTEEPYQINEGFAGQLIAPPKAASPIALIGAENSSELGLILSISPSPICSGEHASWRPG